MSYDLQACVGRTETRHDVIGAERCVAMQAAARGWRNNCDMTLWPLGPERELRSKRARAA